METFCDDKRRIIAGKIINADREMLVMKYRYMVRALYALMPKKIEKGMGISYGTDGESYYYDTGMLLEDYMKGEQDTSLIYLHSVIHCLYMHPFFADKYEWPEIWNLSCDIFACYIMSALQKESVNADQEMEIEKIKTQVKVLTAQSVYRLLSTHKGVAGEEYLNTMAQLFHVDDHTLWYQDEENGDWSDSSYDNEEQKNTASSRKASAYRQWQEIADRTEVEYRAHSIGGEQLQGDEKGTILESLMGIKRDYMDYSDFLRKFAVIEERMRIDMDSFDYNFYMYGLELYKDTPLIEPLEYKDEYSIKEFVIAIDTSGSCDLELIRKFLTVTYDILFESIIDEKSMEVHLIQCDADIQEDYIVKKKEDMNRYVSNLMIRGRGGTDFRPVFEHIAKIREKGGLKGIRGLIYFTDGYGIFPSKPTDYKTAFAFAQMDQSVRVPPWIMKTYIEKELL